jgi:uroporphyrinogen decarboxylase
MANKKAKMTNRERIAALLRKEKPDRVPIWPIALGFYTVYNGKTIGDAYTNAKLFTDSMRKACQELDWVFHPWGASLTNLASEFGGEIKWPASEYSQAPMVTRFPAETVEDVFNLKMPDVETAGTNPMRMAYTEAALHEKNDNCLFNIQLWLGGPFTGACNLAGADKMCKWMIKKPEAAHRMMRLSTDYFLELAKLWKNKYGIEGAIPFYPEPASSNQLISPKQFEEFVMPYLKELHKAVIDMGYKRLFVHICGEQNENLPLWAQIPFGSPGILTFGHEVDLEKAASYFPNEIIMGNLEPAIIQAAIPEEVYQATAEVIKKGKKIKAAGFIFSAGCEFPPNAPLENVKAMNKAVDDFGWYD